MSVIAKAAKVSLVLACGLLASFLPIRFLPRAAGKPLPEIVLPEKGLEIGRAHV